MEKYRFKEVEAQGLADFLQAMLEWDPQKRASAQQMLSHPWLYMPPQYETKMTEKEYRHMGLVKTLIETEDTTDERPTKEEENNIGILGESSEILHDADVENDFNSATSEEEEDNYIDSPSNKYGPNSPLLNIDHGPNPQFVENHNGN